MRSWVVDMASLSSGKRGLASSMGGGGDGVVSVDAAAEEELICVNQPLNDK